MIGTAALISVGVGTLNSFAKNKRPPSLRFLIGSGAAFVILSAIGEGEPEVAKALALAVATTVVIGEGGGVLSYINEGEINTDKKTTKDANKNPNSADEAYAHSSAELYDAEPVETADIESPGVWPSSIAAIHRQPFVLDLITPIPGM